MAISTSAFRFGFVMCLVGCGGGSSESTGTGEPDVAAEDSSALEDTADTEPADTTTVDTTVADTAVADTTVADTFVADTTVADTFVADTFVADTFVADTFVADTFVADTFVADTFVADTFVADTFVADTFVADTKPDAIPFDAGDTGTALKQYQLFLGRSTGPQEARSVRLLPDGGLIVAGSGTFEGDKKYAVLARLSHNGVLLWARRYGAGLGEAFYDVESTSDGGFVAVGRTGGGAGAIDGYYVRVDGYGSLVWSKSVGGTGDDELRALAVTSTGEFVAAGSTVSLNPAVDKSDAFVMRFGGDGTLRWARALDGVLITGSGWDYATGLVVLSGGDLIVGGHTNSFSTSASKEVLLARMTDDGALSWAKTIASGDANLNGLRRTADDRLLLSAAVESSPGAPYQMVLTKATADGVVLFQKRYGSSYSALNDAVELADGNILAAGRSAWWVLDKVTASGAHTWQTAVRPPGFGTADPYKSVAMPDNGYVTVGRDFAGNMMIVRGSSTGAMAGCNALGSSIALVDGSPGNTTRTVSNRTFTPTVTNNATDVAVDAGYSATLQCSL